MRKTTKMVYIVCDKDEKGLEGNKTYPNPKAAERARLEYARYHGINPDEVYFTVLEKEEELY